MIMRTYKIPEKIVKMVNVIYNGSECTVIDGSRPMLNRVAVCLGSFFLLAVDWDMRKTTKHRNTGMRWKLNNFLPDFDFADDLALISSSWRHIQSKFSNLGRYAKMTGLWINTAKTMMMSWNNSTNLSLESLLKGQLKKLVMDRIKLYWAILNTTSGNCILQTFFVESKIKN